MRVLAPCAAALAAGALLAAARPLAGLPEGTAVVHARYDLAAAGAREVAAPFARTSLEAREQDRRRRLQQAGGGLPPSLYDEGGASPSFPQEDAEMPASALPPGLEGLRAPPLDVLVPGAELIGTLEAGGLRYFSFDTNDQDALLMLTSAGGDADIYCTPAQGVLGLMPPSPSFSVWHSEHGAGHDHVFVGTHDSFYADRINCAIAAFTSTDYTLTLDLTDIDAAADQSAVAALDALFDACCASSPMSCVLWKDVEGALGAASPASQVCRLDGIALCDASGNVTHLDISSFDMKCDANTALLPALRALPALKRLDVSENAGITGDVRSTLEAIQGAPLQSIDLTGTALEGEIAEDLLCDDTLLPASLHSLSLGSLVDDAEGEYSSSYYYYGEPDGADDSLAAAKVTMSLPACLLQRPSLAELVLDGIVVPDGMLFGGGATALPPNATLTAFSCERCGLKGEVPADFFDSAQGLLVLDLSHNALSGSVPSPSPGAPLLSVDLSFNNLEGEVPTGFFDSDSLAHVALANNSFDALPSSASASALALLDLENNELAGEIPSWLATAPNLLLLDLSGNLLTGSLPAGWPATRVLMIARNRLTGALPEGIADSAVFAEPALTFGPFAMKHVLDLESNAMSGSLPLWLAQARGPAHLDVRLSGNAWDECKAEAGSREAQLAAAAFAWTGACAVTADNADNLRVLSPDEPSQPAAAPALLAAGAADSQPAPAQSVVAVEEEEPATIGRGENEPAYTTAVQDMSGDDVKIEAEGAASPAGGLIAGAVMGTLAVVAVLVVVGFVAKRRLAARRRMAAVRFMESHAANTSTQAPRWPFEGQHMGA